MAIPFWKTRESLFRSRGFASWKCYCHINGGRQAVTFLCKDISKHLPWFIDLGELHLVMWRESFSWAGWDVKIYPKRPLSFRLRYPKKVNPFFRPVFFSVKVFFRQKQGTITAIPHFPTNNQLRGKYHEKWVGKFTSHVVDTDTIKSG